MNNIITKYINEVLVATPAPGFILYNPTTKSYCDIVYLQEESTISQYVGVDRNKLHNELRKTLDTMTVVNDEQDSLIIETASNVATLQLQI